MGAAGSTRKGSRVSPPLRQGSQLELQRTQGRCAWFATRGRCCMLKISIVEGRKQRRLVVEGKLVAPWSDELKAACERAASGLNGRELVIDLKNVTPISQQGENLLLELMKHGVRCRGCGVFTNQILKQVAPDCGGMEHINEQRNVVSRRLARR